MRKQLCLLRFVGSNTCLVAGWEEKHLRLFKRGAKPWLELSLFFLASEDR